MTPQHKSHDMNMNTNTITNTNTNTIINTQIIHNYKYTDNTAQIHETLDTDILLLTHGR